MAREHQEKGDFKRNIRPIGLISQKHWILTQKIFFIFYCDLPNLAFSLMRPSRPFEFETPALNHNDSESLKNACQTQPEFKGTKTISGFADLDK